MRVDAFHRLVLMPSGREGKVRDNLTILEATRQLGVDLESICGGRQTCGKCLVGIQPDSNTEDSCLSVPTDDELSYAKKHNIDLSASRLACAARIHGDIVLNIPAGSLARKQVVLKSAGHLSIEIVPAVRLVYVEVAPAYLGGRSDWHRMQVALEQQHGLKDLRIDLELARELQTLLREQGGTVTATIWQDTEIIRLESGYVEGLYGAAVDVGSTTVALYLCDLRAGEVLATETMMNPQVSFGEDLISRISYASEPQGMANLHRAIMRGLNQLLEQAANRAGISIFAITDVVIVGNSVMHHILLGINPAPLGIVPFALALDDAVDMPAVSLGLELSAGAKAHLLPCIAGYVGADNVAVLLSQYELFDDDGITLIVDIGTNAEILLGSRGRILSASSPTGPAFEGAQITHGLRAAAGAIERVRINGDTVRYKVIGDHRWSDEIQSSENLSPTGICGSAIIEIVAELFTSGIVNTGGKFILDRPDLHPRLKVDGNKSVFVLAYDYETASGEEIVITQGDIRAVQLAKAALYAGIRLMMDRLGISRVDRIRLAGAFGSVIDPYYAMRIGLIPDCILENVESIGNVAGDGARIALLNKELRAKASELARTVEYVETAAETHFQDYFVDALFLPHATDHFENLDGEVK